MASLSCSFINSERHQCENNAVNDNLCQEHLEFREQIRKEVAIKKLTDTPEGGLYFRYHLFGVPCAYREDGKKCKWNVFDEKLICCEHHKDHEIELQQERKEKMEFEEGHKEPCKAVLKSGKVCGVISCRRHRPEYGKEWKKFVEEHSGEVENNGRGEMMKKLSEMYQNRGAIGNNKNENSL
jgi:hypothetical protein